MKNFLLFLILLCCCEKTHATTDTLPCDSPAVFLPGHFMPQCETADCDYKPVFNCVPAEYEMQIFDRWGNLLFTTKDYGQGWNGEKEKMIYPNGDYYCKIIFRFRKEGEQQTRTTSFTLIR